MTETNETRGLRSDGELVQAATDRFDFHLKPGADAADADHRSWCDLASMSGHVSRSETEPSDYFYDFLGV
ncbi:MAG: hypothetical protein ACK5MQ_15495 [Pikeienuella sp.]